MSTPARSAKKSKTIAQLRAEASQHARQLEAVHWLDVNALAARWGVSGATVRQISRDELPYLALGSSSRRRYSPDDVQAYEARAKHGTTPDAGSP